MREPPWFKKERTYGTGAGRVEMFSLTTWNYGFGCGCGSGSHEAQGSGSGLAPGSGGYKADGGRDERGYGSTSVYNATGGTDV